MKMRKVTASGDKRNYTNEEPSFVEIKGSLNIDEVQQLIWQSGRFVKKKLKNVGKKVEKGEKKVEESQKKLCALDIQAKTSVSQFETHLGLHMRSGISATNNGNAYDGKKADDRR